MKRICTVLFLLSVALFQTGCSSNSQQTSTSMGNVDASGQPVSSVPWNKPESWETQGQLGGLGH